MSENTDKRTATQRIEDLEKILAITYKGTSDALNTLQNLVNLPNDMALVKEALKLLNKKTEAIVQVATPETGITVESVSALVVKMNVEDLKAQVTGFLANGQLAVADTVAPNSYVVAEELNSDGTVANPRIQFRLDSQDEATVTALTGKKVGDTVSFGDNKFSAKVLEIYSITEGKAPEVTPAEATSTETSAATESPPAESTTTATAADTPNGPSNDALAAPTETPVAEFVPSAPGTMVTVS